MSLTSSYTPDTYEETIYGYWMESGVGHPESQSVRQHQSTNDSYTVLMPPPNLTGSLHAGHAFQHYLMDTLSRKARLKGKKTLWYPGVDHAGIQLEGVIDKLIKKGEFDELISSSIPKDIPQNDIPQWLKNNKRELWLECAWSKVNEWRDHQKKQSAILGDTPDYSRSLFTLDERATRMVMLAFEKYWEDGLIYKGEYLVNWSVGLQTALSDFQQDVEWIEQKDPFITFTYVLKRVGFENSILSDEEASYLESRIGEINVSTVRPETIFGDVALAIHPDILKQKLNNDSLYDKVSDTLTHGKMAITYTIEALNVEDVTLIISDKVDPDFGSGTLKVTPAHDQFDYDLFKEFRDNGLLKSGFEQAIGRDGKLTAITGNFAGLSVLQGRMLTIKRLLEGGYCPVKPDHEEVMPSDYSSDDQFLLLDYKKQIELLRESYPNHMVDWDYTHNVLYCERSKTPIEPLISSEYFLSYHTKSKEVGKSLQQIGLEGIAQTTFYPEEMRSRGEKILEDVHDWCISRKLVWGHRIPVWYNIKTNPGQRFVAREEMDTDFEVEIEGKTVTVQGSEMMHIGREKPQGDDWIQEDKVFDTWFSSCLWPLTTLNFFDTLNGQTNTDFDTYYPTQVMVTGVDIFYAWIVRMIVLCTYWTGQTPFKHLVITPTILDEKGKKMSKSVGNGLQPDETISKYSSDALRLALLGGMIPGRNMRMGGSIADTLCEKYRNFGNKVWNVARFLEQYEEQ